MVKVVVWLLWRCLSGRMCFLWRLNLILVEKKMSNVGEYLFSMVMQVNVLRLLFFYDSVVWGR